MKNRSQSAVARFAHAAGRALVPATAALVVCLGCERGREVSSYAVPKEPEPEAAAPQPAPPVTLAAAGPMRWELPAGWSEIENPNTMRFATISAGEGDEQIEIAITQLGGAAGGIAANINRWRGQIGLEPASDEELQQAVLPVRARGTQGVWVDLVGPAGEDEEGDEGAAPRMFAAIFPTHVDTWFIKTVGTAAALERHRAGFVELCESVAFDDIGAAPGTGGAPAPRTSPNAVGGLSWDDPPAGWERDATPKPMSVASFTVSGGGQEASLTITPLGGTQDLLANVNRWRGQVGLDPLAALEDEPPVPVDVAGDPGQLVDLAGPNGHTLAVMTTRGPTTWFYKLTGPDPLVADQRAGFEAFIRSLQLVEGSG